MNETNARRTGWQRLFCTASLSRTTLVIALLSGVSLTGYAQQIDFRHTITGASLNIPASKADTPAAKEFFESGKNPYNDDKEALKKGKEEFSYACAGCHGHAGEGKLGPGLADNYYTYPKNKTDKGLFETIYGGAQAMMGPQESFLSVDQMLLVMAWVRELGKGKTQAKR